MFTVVFILMFLSAVLLMLGLMKPAWAKQKSRGRVFVIYGLATVALFITAIILTPEEGVNNGQESQQATEAGEEDDSTAGQSETEESVFASATVHDYEVVQEQNSSIPGRERRTLSIVAPTAETQLDRAATVRQALLDLEERTGAEAMTVWLIMHEQLVGYGLNYASGNYIPDGCGFSGQDCGGDVWSILATDETASPEQIQVAINWDEHSDSFLDENGLVDEEAYIPYLAEQLGIDEAEVRFPVVTLDRVDQ